MRVVATTVTISEGTYIFYNILMGQYTVKETDPIDLISVSDIDCPDNTDNLIAVMVRSTAQGTTLWTKISNHWAAKQI